MGRPPGSRNACYDERRSAIAQRALARLAQPEGAKASLRELAQASGVSVATLRHYFGDRVGVLQAAMREGRASGETWLTLAAEAQLEGCLEESLTWYLRALHIGWENGVGAMFSESLAAGTGSEELGASVVVEVLEPLLQALEVRLAHHRAVGQLPEHTDLRFAALSLVTPLLMALLHQGPLSGRACRPLDIDAYLRDHVAHFALGWGCQAA